MNGSHFEDLLAIKEQITAVNFRSELDIILEELVFNGYSEYWDNGEISSETVSEAYQKMKRMMGE
ncbi:MAG: hypothetical protein J6I98_03260 [Clostridia bacterium]|nr:hypothetical protein [Clostridia bacterium]